MSSLKEYIHKNLAQKILEYRLELGLTQEQFAAELYKNPKFIGHLERNERRMSLDSIIELMEYLKIQPYELFLFKEPFKWEE